MKVPKGTSDYQATWIVDDDDDENGDVDEESSEDDDVDDMMDEAMERDEEENNSQVLTEKRKLSVFFSTQNISSVKIAMSVLTSCSWATAE